MRDWVAAKPGGTEHSEERKEEEFRPARVAGIRFKADGTAWEGRRIRMSATPAFGDLSFFLALDTVTNWEYEYAACLTGRRV